MMSKMVLKQSPYVQIHLSEIMDGKTASAMLRDKMMYSTAT